MDELTAPLGQSRRPTAPPRSLLGPTVAIAGAILLLAGAAVWLLPFKQLLHENRAAIPEPKQVRTEPRPAPVPTDTNPTGSIRTPSEPASRTITIIDGITGNRHEVTIAAPEPPSTPPPQRPR